jgi:hypothetical protein
MFSERAKSRVATARTHSVMAGRGLSGVMVISFDPEDDPPAAPFRLPAT